MTAVVEPSVASASPPERPPVRIPPPSERIRPRLFRPVDYLVIAGSAASAMAFVWVLYFRLLPVTGIAGYWTLSFFAFLVIYGAIAFQLDGRLVAQDRVMAVIIGSAATLILVPLVLIVVYVIARGIDSLRYINYYRETLATVSSDTPVSEGGVAHSIVGTVQQTGIALLISAPLGILTAIFLNEIGGRMTRVVRFFVDAMSGLPSIVAGLFIYAVLIVQLGWNYSGFAAALALSMLMLPAITRTSEEVLRLIPGGLREAALALGAPEWRSIRVVVLPTARAGLITAVILGIARAVGETAPLIMTSSGSSFMQWNPFAGPQASLPLTVYSLVRLPSDAMNARGWSAALILVLIVLASFILARIVGRPRTRGRRIRGRSRRSRRAERASS